MSVTTNIVASYRGPRAVVRQLLNDGVRESRALAFVMGFAAVAFVAQMPRLSRVAHLTEQDLNMLLGGALLGTVFIMPLMLYVLALVVHLIARLLGWSGTPFAARIALFWALVATTPILLLHGLVAGFIGPGAQQFTVGLVWFSVFFWFWIAGMREAGSAPK
jgi:hypothetical protein